MAALALPASSDQVDALLGYLSLLQRWNGTYNLTSVRDPRQMLTQHLADCLAVVAPLKRELPSRAAQILDVGSGGGLPGAVLAVMCPEIRVTCVDAVGKKAAFIQQVGVELRLPTLKAVHSRVEQLPDGSFDAITSRAFASLADFVAATSRQLAAGGVWMAMKGRSPADEIAALPADVRVFHVEPLAVPGLDAERCLVWMRRVG
ncbi:MAG TPA: 16S rRNA (guanine(527)-N(7))-methyltransferase RsmG [Burkholderiaceae bacterium]|nr:16S rRNA (guanine(527)-N(7))-methyltransferase RsmG [Burkholderiaceae bacterium]